MKFIIDADTYIYIIAYYNKEITDTNTLNINTYNYIRTVLKELCSDSFEYVLVFTSKTNFRKSISEEYKSKRLAKPEHFKHIKDYIKLQFHTLEVDNYEADDVIASLATKHKDAIIVHTDKDLLQIPGFHLFREKEVFIEEYESYKYLMTQMLMGDKNVDNIAGIPKIGEKTAGKLLLNKSIIDMLSIILREYEKYYKENFLTEFYKNYKLLKLETTLFDEQDYNVFSSFNN